MTQFCLYKNPSDHPDLYVLRKWNIVEGNPEPVQVPKEEFLLLSPNLETIKEFMYPYHMYWLPRQPTDDPCIVGTWI
jgi:hypothetical protein